MGCYAERTARLVALLIAVFASDVVLSTGPPLAGPESAPMANGTPKVAELLRGLPLAFEPNRGQADSETKFVARGHGYCVFLNADEAVLALGTDKESWVRFRPVGANPAPAIFALDELPGKSNYLNGATPSTWRSNIPNYARVLYRGVYPGIDLVYHGDEGNLEYDWVVQPGTDPAVIRLSFPGSQHIRLDGGDLIIETAEGAVRNRQPVAYQNIGGTLRHVSVKYSIERSRASFVLGAYDRRMPLIIDPTIVYLKGGYGGAPVAGSDDGYIYLLSGSAPAPQVVTKLTPSGDVVFSAQLGFLGATTAIGGYDKAVIGMAVDAAGNIYVSGSSGPGLATTAGAFQPAARGPLNAFVAKLNPTGSGLIYSTFLGGSSQDFGGPIALDGSGNAYLAGRATSIDFPTTPGVLGKCTNSGSLFVAKLNPLGSALVYSGCVAGLLESAGSIAADAAGNAYVAGSSSAADFPTTPGALQTSPPGYSCGPVFPSCYGFVFKLNPTGSAFAYSTLLPAPVRGISGLALDSSGSVYVAGTAAFDFPTTPGALKANVSQGEVSLFVVKLNPAGSGLVYSAIPASNLLLGARIAVDAAGAVYAAGTGGGVVSIDPLQGGFAGPCQTALLHPFPCVNAFIFKLNPAGSAFVYSTNLGYHGGGGADGIAVDNSGNAYLTGSFPGPTPPTWGLTGGLLKVADAGHTPYFSTDGVVNAASFRAGLCTQGQIETLFGSNVTNVQGVLTASSLPLPTQLAGTSVFVNGVAAPIFAVANVNGKQQINFQVPVLGSTVTLTNNGVSSVPVYIDYPTYYITPPGICLQPGIFTTDGSRGAIQHGLDYQLVTPASPATRGEVLVLYATGLGGGKADGTPAPNPPVSFSPGYATVTVGGKPAEVLFAGLTPGLVGLNQVNFRVPADSPSGDADVVLSVVLNSTTGAVAKSNAVKLAVQ